MNHAKKKANNWEVFVENGRQPTSFDVLDWVEEVQELGAGEIFVVSVDNDGVCKGPDYEFVSRLGQICKVPLIYAGGTSKQEDVLELSKLYDRRNCALTLTSFNKETITNIKLFLEKFTNIRIR